MRTGSGILIRTLFFILVFLLPSTSFSITLQEEEVLGEEFHAEVTRRYPMVEDPLVVAHVRKVGRRIVDALEDPPFPFTFDVVRNPTINAFAGPGGHIFVHSGLITAMEDESELAGILAHEIAHVTCRHISESIERQKLAGFGAVAGMVAAIGAAAAGAEGDAVAGILTGSQAASQSAILSFTRENEEQADERGLSYLVATGYPRDGLLTMLRKIRSTEWYTTEDIPTYLRTHPGTEARISFVASWDASRAETVGTRALKPVEIDKTAFDRMRLRTMGRYGRIADMLPKLEALLRQEPDSPEVNAALGLLLSRAGRNREAISHLERVVVARPLDPVALGDLGTARVRAGRFEEGIPLLEEAVLVEEPDNRRLFDLGLAYAATKRFRKSVTTFEAVIRRDARLKTAWYNAGEAFGRLGQSGMAHLYLGRFFEETKEFKTARFHYGKALSLLPEDHARRQDATEWLERSGKKEKKEKANGKDKTSG